MRLVKLFTMIVMTSASLSILASCHSSKKYAYIKHFHKDLKKELADGKAKRKADTVKVVYPELAMFDFGKDQVKGEALPTFNHFATVLKKYDRIHFYINGYTDNVGPADANVSLSQRRAENAKAVMETDGVSGVRMKTNGMGESNPMQTNSTEEGRQANRRVEFVLYEKK